MLDMHNGALPPKARFSCTYSRYESSFLRELVLPSTTAVLSKFFDSNGYNNTHKFRIPEFEYIQKGDFLNIRIQVHSKDAIFEYSISNTCEKRDTLNIRIGILKLE